MAQYKTPSPPQPTPSTDSIAASKEKALLDFLRRIESNRSGYYAVLMHMSDLSSANRQAHFLRIAARSLNTLASQPDVSMFEFANGDIALLCHEVPVDDVDQNVFKVRALFAEDPLIQGADGSDEDQFSSWFDLTQDEDYRQFIAIVVDQMDFALKKASEREDAASNTRAARTMRGAALEPAMLVDITQKLREVRIADIIGHQPAVRINLKGKGELLFREQFVVMHDLQERIAPGVNLFANHWLFQYLSETIDVRVLETSSRYPFDDRTDPISVNLNISTVMSRPFQAFHDQVGDHADKIVVEIQVIDIFSDMGGYFYARDWLRERGYRVLIDGLNPLSVHFFDPTVLGADFLKIGWGAETRGGIGQEQSRFLRDVVSREDGADVILTRVDSDKGVQWGMGMGIRCFQGYYIDKIVTAMAAKGLI